MRPPVSIKAAPSRPRTLSPHFIYLETRPVVFTACVTLDISVILRDLAQINMIGLGDKSDSRVEQDSASVLLIAPCHQCRYWELVIINP